MLEGAKVARPDLDDPSIRCNVSAEIARTATAVDELVRSGRTGFEVTGPAHASDVYPVTENWAKALGAYQQWSSAVVTVEGGIVTMVVTVHAEDHYNFNAGAADIATNTPDDVNGRFTEIGWAKPFDTHGDVTRTVTWAVGDPPTDPQPSPGPEGRNPGREDRVDGLGGTGGRPGGDHSTGHAGGAR